mmetsp:Transcript_38156/g.113049  ORF Transcript_38156/g.113049 Transcript_38156/m.113049 type:complete len:353 (+) Transcript_38156:590-1648(+)
MAQAATWQAAAAQQQQHRRPPLTAACMSERTCRPTPRRSYRRCVMSVTHWRSDCCMQAPQSPGSTASCRNQKLAMTRRARCSTSCSPSTCRHFQASACPHFHARPRPPVLARPTLAATIAVGTWSWSRPTRCTKHHKVGTVWTKRSMLRARPPDRVVMTPPPRQTLQKLCGVCRIHAGWHWRLRCWHCWHPPLRCTPPRVCSSRPHLPHPPAGRSPWQAPMQGCTPQPTTQARQRTNPWLPPPLPPLRGTRQRRCASCGLKLRMMRACWSRCVPACPRRVDNCGGCGPPLATLKTATRRGAAPASAQLRVVTVTLLLLPWRRRQQRRRCPRPAESDKQSTWLPHMDRAQAPT